jgi:hypothetical protein
MRRATKVLGILALLMSAVVALPSAAEAFSYDYCGVLTQPYSSCSQTSGAQYNSGTYVTNFAYYNGSGYISVCEKIESSSLGQISRMCNPASCYCNGQNSGYVYDPLDYDTGVVGDNWPAAHTINGTLVTGFS